MDDQGLSRTLRQLDGQSYRAYKQLAGHYRFPDFDLDIAHVQGDPFAAPSRISIGLSHEVAEFPDDWRQTPLRRVALADALHRQVYQIIPQVQQRRGSGKSGRLIVSAVSQAILERTAVQIHEGFIELRLGVGLPAFGRRIAGHEAISLLTQDIPQLVARSLMYAALPQAELLRQIETVEDATALRQQLTENGLVAFIANGSILPRRSGVDERPLQGQAVAFQAPAGLAVTLQTPHSGAIAGMGIPAGITLIVGGGYHGKSTVLRAIEQGVYNHIPGDGRERVVTEDSAVKIRAEDGRSVVGVNISPFINNLPQGISTQQFSTPNASGSTSQAAGIIEAIEAGAKVLLIDEDTAATNFMIRDRNMQALIAKDQEPITPFVDKVQQLYDDYGISTILVMGGSGDYFQVADTVIALDSYQPRVVTDQAKAIAQADQDRRPEGGQQFGQLTPRHLDISGLEQHPRGNKIKVRDVDAVVIGHEAIDLRAVEQLIEPNQVRAIAQAINDLQHRGVASRYPLPELLDRLMEQLTQQGMDSISPFPMADLAMFRRFELAAAINRLRQLQVRSLRHGSSQSK
ncbi:MAG: ABC-ATPase domain-containing protein [Cyanobacteria bacterium P01_G01_bin.38]